MARFPASLRSQLSQVRRAIAYWLVPSLKQAQEDCLRLAAELEQATRAAEKARSERDDSYRLVNTALGSIPEYIYVKDRQSRFLMSSVAHAGAMGCTPEEMVGKTDFDIFPYSMAVHFFADEQSLMLTGKPLINKEEQSMTAGGRRLWVLSTKVPLHDEAGQVVGLVGISRDITELKERERQLQSNERFIQQVADTAPDIIYVFDIPSDSYVYTSFQAMQRILGYSSREMQAMRNDWFTTLTHPDDVRLLDEWRAWLAKARDDEVSEFTFRLRHKNGEWRWFWARDRVFARDADGYPTQLIGVAQDITERLQAERALRQHNQYLTALSEITPALMNRLDPNELLSTLLEQARLLMRTEDAFIDLLPGNEAELMSDFLSEGRFIEYNRKVSPGEGVVGEVWRTGHPVVVEDYAAWPQRIQECAGTGVSAVLGVPIKSGERVFGVLSVSHSDEGRRFEQYEIDLLSRIGELVSIALDNARLYTNAQRELEERKRVENELRASERRYRAVVENQTELICRYLPDATLTFVNDAYCRYFGKSREELLGRCFLTLHQVRDRPAVEQAIDALMRGETDATSYVEQALTASGELRWLEWSDRAIRDEHGNVVEYQAIGRDIHEQRLVELALKAERDFIATVIGTTAAIICVVDGEGRFVSINNACERLTGYRNEELAGKRVWETVIPPDEVDSVRQALGHLEAGHFPNTNINHWRLKDGSLRLIEWSNNVLLDEAGELSLVVASGIDITERQQLEQRNLELALEREKVALLGNFMRDASHDFRTPLSILNTNLYLIRRTPGSEPFEHRLAEMERQVVHLTRLVDQLLTMTRLDSAAELNRAPVDVNTLVENLANAHRSAASARGITLSASLDPDVPLANLDAFKLTEAINNIISNALQYTGEGGTISVRTRLSDNELCIEVQDTGIGIPPEHLPHIFDRFYRADKARSSSDGGSGLGLAIALKIVELHQGTITAESVPNQGSTFTIRLPLEVEPVMV